MTKSELPDFANRLIEKHAKREALAQEVFNKFSYRLDKNQLIAVFDGTSFTKWEALNQSILENLDADTLPYFVDIVLKNRLSASQSIKAHKSHAEDLANKAEVFKWLNKNSSNLLGKKVDEVNESLKRLVPYSLITVDRWRKEWKRNNTSAGKSTYIK